MIKALSSGKSGPCFSSFRFRVGFHSEIHNLPFGRNPQLLLLEQRIQQEIPEVLLPPLLMYHEHNQQQVPKFKRTVRLLSSKRS